MSRREFSRALKVAVIKRTTRDNQVWCEKCALPAKKWQIDHVIPDSHGGEPTIENAMLICDACYAIKNPIDASAAANIKRIEAAALGAEKPNKAKIQQPIKPGRSTFKQDQIRALREARYGTGK